MRAELTDLKETFQLLDDWEDKYRFVIDLGKQLPAMDDTAKREENLVRGCQSQVWLDYQRQPDGTLRFSLDSDAFIVRGLISIVLSAINDTTPADIVAFDFNALFEELQLLQHLSPTRGNGLRAMVERIRQIAAHEASIQP